FSSPTIHTLPEAYTLKDMTDSFERVIDFDLTYNQNAYTIAYPVAANQHQQELLSKGFPCSHDHLCAWANGCTYISMKKGDVGVLLVDLTPGQIAAKQAWGNAFIGWMYNVEAGKSVILSEEQQQDVDDWTSQDVFDKLVRHVLPPSDRKLELVGFLRPEGALPNLSASELESTFNGTPVKWIQLIDIAYGAAVVMMVFLEYRKLVLPKAPLPIGITLANGKTITIIPANAYPPVDCKFLFTNSQENQTTATVKVLRGTIPCQELKIEDLAPKPRGEARLKVTLRIRSGGHWSLELGEFETGRITNLDSEGICIQDEAEIDAYEKETTNRQIDIVIGADGVVGELPP
ncbi:7963_t:CDS:1, partial [Acaulospora colombiana]